MERVSRRHSLACHLGIGLVRGRLCTLCLGGIDDIRLRGKWLHLITPTEVLAMGAVDGARRDARAADGPQRDEDDADDARIVPLR